LIFILKKASAGAGERLIISFEGVKVSQNFCPTVSLFRYNFSAVEKIECLVNIFERK